MEEVTRDKDSCCENRGSLTILKYQKLLSTITMYIDTAAHVVGVRL